MAMVLVVYYFENILRKLMIKAIVTIFRCDAFVFDTTPYLFCELLHFTRQCYLTTWLQNEDDTKSSHSSVNFSLIFKVYYQNHSPFLTVFVQTAAFFY